MSDTSFTPDRRSFLKTLSVAATGVVLGSAMPAFAQATQPKRRRYAIVGVGSGSVGAGAAGLLVAAACGGSSKSDNTPSAGGATSTGRARGQATSAM